MIFDGIEAETKRDTIQVNMQRMIMRGNNSIGATPSASRGIFSREADQQVHAIPWALSRFVIVILIPPHGVVLDGFEIDTVRHGEQQNVITCMRMQD